MTEVTIHVDGACVRNPGPGGYAAVLRLGDHEKRVTGGAKHTTNNRMELAAAIFGLKALTKPCTVTIYSDSTYLVNGLTDQKGRDYGTNTDLWKRLFGLVDMHTVKAVWVKGLAGDQHNEQVHTLAEHAARQPGHPVDLIYECANA